MFQIVVDLDGLFLGLLGFWIFFIFAQVVVELVVFLISALLSVEHVIIHVVGFGLEVSTERHL